MMHLAEPRVIQPAHRTKEGSGVSHQFEGRNFTVIVDAGPRACEVRLESRRDGILLFWKESRALFSEQCEPFDNVVSHHVRAIRLPMDMNIAEATSVVEPNKIKIRIPCTSNPNEKE